MRGGLPLLRSPRLLSWVRTASWGSHGPASRRHLLQLLQPLLPPPHGPSSSRKRTRAGEKKTRRRRRCSRGPCQSSPAPPSAAGPGEAQRRPWRLRRPLRTRPSSLRASQELPRSRRPLRWPLQRKQTRRQCRAHRGSPLRRRLPLQLQPDNCLTLPLHPSPSCPRQRMRQQLAPPPPIRPGSSSSSRLPSQDRRAPSGETVPLRPRPHPSVSQPWAPRRRRPLPPPPPPSLPSRLSQQRTMLPPWRQLWGQP